MLGFFKKCLFLRMVHLALVALSLLALASAGVVERQQFPSKIADGVFLQRQKDILRLLYHVHNPNIHKDQVDMGRAYDIEQNLPHYRNVDLVKHFLELHQVHALLPKGHVFSIMYERQRHEAISLFHLFYYANNFETFYKTLCWAREHVNEGMFVYALTVAVLHREDCHGIILPPPYEIYPYYFVNSEVIHQANTIKMKGIKNLEHLEHVHVAEKNVAIINSNYSGWYVNHGDEQRLTYFTEDVGLNSYYYYLHMDYPFWMGGDEFKLHKDRRGEFFYYMHQQLLARYYMERLSNGLGEIPMFSWHWPIKEGYHPYLVYHNGLEFPIRPDHYDLRHPEHLEHLQQVEDYERRIRDVVDSGIVLPENHQAHEQLLHDPESIDLLGRLVECSPDSPNTRYFKNVQVVARHLLGNSIKPKTMHTIAPSALEHYQTSMRDPVFYQLYKRLLTPFFQFKETLPVYTREEVSCHGVNIENVDVEKMQTYFDHFDIDLTNVVHQNTDEMTRETDDISIRARQRRLNHKQFTVRARVHADHAQLVLVRFYLAPKHDETGRTIPLNENRHNFIELDQFKFELKEGQNILTRNSRDGIWNIQDWTPGHTLYEEINRAMKGDMKFHLDMSEAHNGWPDRLLLPKGTKSGLPHIFFMHISPYHEPKVPFGKGFDTVLSSGVGSGARHLSDEAFGFPLDRHLHEETFYTPNMFVKDVLIYHKSDTEVINAAYQD